VKCTISAPFHDLTFPRSSGLGLSTAKTILQKKGYVAILDLQEPDTSAIGPETNKARYWELDVTQVEDIIKVVDEVIAWTKQTGALLGGIINCAGVGVAAKVGEASCPGPFQQTLTRALFSKQIISPDGQPHSLDVWNFAIGVNLTGTFNLTRIACKYLVNVPPEGPDGERGVVVMVASAAAVRSHPYFALHSTTFYLTHISLKASPARLRIPLPRVH
jgi:NAD(P)-dependent dehydrogenase (short-subunit alcohol dehydrogenase family)